MTARKYPKYVYPTGRKVIVEKRFFSRDHKNAAGIITEFNVDVEEKQLNDNLGIIREIGPSAWKYVDDGEQQAEVGDVVFISRHSGVVFRDEDDGKAFQLINDVDVFGIVDDNALIEEFKDLGDR